MMLSLTTGSLGYLVNVLFLLLLSFCLFYLLLHPQNIIGKTFANITALTNNQCIYNLTTIF